MMACRSFAKSIFRIKTNSGNVNKHLNFVRFKSEGTKVVLLNSFNTVGLSTAYLLKKTSNLFKEICLQEPRNVERIEGIAADLNSINTPPVVTYSVGVQSAPEALQDATIVVLLEKPTKKKKKKEKKKVGRYKIKNENYMSCIRCDKSSDKKASPDNCEQKSKLPCTRYEKYAHSLNKIFLKNAESCAKTAELYASICPGALFAIATRPINSVLPLICKVAKNTNHNVDFRKFVGIMSSDVVAANTVWAERTKLKLDSVKVPIIGGGSYTTLVPLFSQLKHQEKLSEEDYASLTEKLRKHNENNLHSKNAPLANAACLAKFIILLGNIIRGKEITETVFIKSDSKSNKMEYAAGPAQLGPAGIQFMHPLPELSSYEKLLADSVEFYLRTDVKRGEDYAENYLRKKDKD